MKTLNIIICLCFWSSGYSNHIIDLYKPEKSLISVNEDLRFWNKKLQNSNEASFHLQLANTWLKHFKITSEIISLNKAVDIVENVYDSPLLNKGAVCRTLARLYITQHRFCESLDMALESAEIGDNDRATRLLLYDVYSELGMEEWALEILQLVSNNPDFQYLIRAAKWEDAHGNLNNAIHLLKKARDKAESGKDKGQLAWIYSNLGDFYGHDGQIDQSKEHFIKAIEINPADWYSLKGLAWIHYSNYGDAEMALEILDAIKVYNQSPEIGLLKSKLHAYQGKKYYAEVLEQQVMNTISDDKYGILYRMVLSEYYSDNGKDKQAIDLAQAEVQSRNIPETNALLAYCQYQAGMKEQAWEVVKSSVYEKTYEPQALYHILKASSFNPTIQRLIISELKGTSYELGPQLSNKINSISKSVKSDLVNVF